MKSNFSGLIQKLNSYCNQALEGASGVCVQRSHYEVSVEHLMLKLLEDERSDIPLLLAHFEVDAGAWVKQLQHELEALKNGNPGKPVFSDSLQNLFEEAWVVSSMHLSQIQIRSGALLASMADNPAPTAWASSCPRAQSSGSASALTKPARLKAHLLSV